MRKISMVALVSVAAFTLVFSLGCSKKYSDPEEIADAMISHMKSMVKIIADNKDDCEKAAKEIETYTAKNKKEFEEVKEASKSMEKKMADMSSEEKKKFDEKMLKKMESSMKDSMSAVMEFTQKCPDQAGKISTAMETILGK